jgi:uncharacterized repeat protein (TIGR01451 family)
LRLIGGTGRRPFGLGVRACVAAVLAMACALSSGPARATEFQYSNTTTGAINDNGTSCTGELVRTFSVGTSYTISDVDIGVLLSHTYRSDLRISLQSPAGTTVEVMRNSGGSADNLNVRLDDEASANISTHTTNDSTSGTIPPYANNFIPRNALSAFDGENASGTWTLRICDSVAQDTGTFLRADLYIRDTPTNYADLSLTKTVSSATPASGSNITYTLTVQSAAASTLTATGVTVQDSLPLGVSFVSASGTGSYSSGTGVWTVGSLAPGASAAITLTVNVTATAGATITNSAEVSASSADDIDSTPGNGSTTEDDDASVSFTVSGTRTAGTPPTLVCPAGSVLLDWNAQSWTSGSSTGSATLTGIGTINFSVASDGTYNAPLALTSDNTGGFAATELSLYQNIEYTNRTQVTTTTVTLPTAVPGAQFRIFDVDYAVNDFADKLTVTGSFNGSAVTPTLTNGVANYVTGNVAIGDAGSGSTSANGNVVITFSSPVDTIVIVYGNHTTAPADPDGQAISIHDFTFCNPVATIGVTKISNVLSDGVTPSGLFAIPGATVRYCILVTNNGSGTTTAVSATDAVPAEMTFVAGSMRTGTSCAAAATVEDDDASGGDESDPFGMSVSGSTVTGTATSLAPSASVALVFNATIN